MRAGWEKKRGGGLGSTSSLRCDNAGLRARAGGSLIRPNLSTEQRVDCSSEEQTEYQLKGGEVFRIRFVGFVPYWGRWKCGSG